MPLLQLPPTPADFERVELVLRSLKAIEASTDDIMKTVAEHAFAGFPQHVAKGLASNVAQTETLCRHCQHCLTLCNPRAVLISDGDEGRNLPLEVLAATDKFEQVAAAVQSVAHVQSGAPQPIGSSAAALQEAKISTYGPGFGNGSAGGSCQQGYGCRAVWDEL